MSERDTHMQGLRKAAALWTEGQGEKARALCRLLLTARPDSVEALRLLADVERGLGRREEAYGLLARAIGLDSRSARLHCDLGNLLIEMGRADEAMSAWREALVQDPRMAEAHANLGAALAGQGRMDDALAAIHQAIACAPEDALPHCNLGVVFLRQNRLTDAETAFRQALLKDPELAEALDGLATIFMRLGRNDDALANARRAAELRPRSAAVQFNLGNVLNAVGATDEAIVAYRRAIALAPGLIMAWHNLGNLLNDVGRHGQAAVCFRQVLGRDPTQVAAASGLGLALAVLGRHDEAATSVARGLSTQPDSSLALSLHAWLGLHQPGLAPAMVLERHREWERRIGQRLAGEARPWRVTVEPERQLRIGILSTGLGIGTAGSLTIGGLERLDRARFDLRLYDARPRTDGLAARFRAVGQWHEVATLPDTVLAERIRADAIDILIDLDGHAPGNRLPVFARRPAPVQIAWAGYAGTRGIAAIDRLLTDDVQAPVGADGHFSERLIRLPGLSFSYTPPADAPPIGPLPAGADRPVTFANFGHPLRLSDACLSLWAGVLHAVAGSRLLLCHRGLDDPEVAGRIVNLLGALGIEAGRIDCLGAHSPAEALAIHHRVDLALDSYPVGGAATIGEALWMGVPTLVLPGPGPAGRRAAAMVQAAGFAPWVAKDWAGFIRLAADWATDRKRLAEFRATARARVGASALCDHGRLARALGEALRQAWREWCRDQGAKG